MQRQMHLYIAFFCLSGLAFSVATPYSNYTTTKYVDGSFALSAGVGITVNTTTIRTGARITKPGCHHRGGNLIVPYPFGIGIGCSIGLWFNINCNTSFNPPKPFTGTRTSTMLKVFDIPDSKLGVSISTMVTQKCYARYGAIIKENTTLADLSTSPPFTFSEENKLNVIWCDDRALLSGYKNCCLSLCSDREHVIGSRFSGIGCCQTSIPKGLQYFEPSLYAWRNDTRVRSFDPYSYAFFSQQDMSFTFLGAADFSDPAFMNRTQARNPTGLQWVHVSRTEALTSNDSDRGTGVEGMAFFITEVAERVREQVWKCQIDSPSPLPVPSLFDFLFLLAMAIGLYLLIKEWILARRINYNFKQHGGWLYQAKINQLGRGKDLPRVFTAKELAKATNNYADDMILGRGGYSVVYKGILLDSRAVAIKKSKMMDENETEQFINELAILAQINHRNVVRLLGCCFESETPILVSEFMSNNTLYHHIHNGGGTAWLSWQMRLKIACDSASALSYLHSAASVPIIHRDIKSTNILLDDDYAAKVSDFGASRLIPLNESKLATLVVGTMGYLDPEYYLTNQLTKKSDVYSFGVVMAELLTGKKPVFLDSNEVCTHLGTYFKSLEKKDLIQILEPRLVEEGTIEQLKAMAKLVKECLSVNSRGRPTMKEVSSKLDDMLRTSMDAKRAPKKKNPRQKLLAAFKACTSRNEKK